MKKLNINRDMPEPSLEDMEKHMNFEEVLNRASSSGTPPAKGVSKIWIIGGAAVVATVIATVFFTSQSNVTDSNYQSMTMEGGTVEKITSIEPLEADIILTAAVSEKETEETVEEEDLSYDDFYPSPEPVIVEYYKPKLVSSIPFVFEESFGLKEQWQSLPELSIYEKLSFQPIDKAQQSMLKIAWDRVDFNQDENGQYYLILYKEDQGVVCPVTPVFEKDDYLDALDAYQEHQP